MQRQNPCGRARIRVGIGLGQSGGDGSELLFRVLHREPVAESSMGKEPVGIPAGIIPIHSERKEELRLPSLVPHWIGKIIIPRHDPDDQVVFSIDQYGATDDVGVGSVAELPEIVAQESNPAGTRALFIFQEESSQRWLDGQCFQDAGGTFLILLLVKMLKSSNKNILHVAYNAYSTMDHEDYLIF